VARARPKRFEFVASLDDDGRVGAGGEAVELGDEWSAESLVLAGLLRCSLTSLRYHARRGGIDDVRARGTAKAVVTQRESDGRYAFVEVEARLEAEIEPPPAPEALAELLASAERGCFVGASLTVTPTYRWRVNGNDL
jgi:uncharacterized OsmC-like protein